jgi:hypothetical protein
MLRLVLTISAAAILVAGCETRPAADPCAGWKMMRPTAADVRSMSPQFVADVLEHNEFGVSRGCWKVPR